MDLNTIKLSLIRDNNVAGIQVIDKIQELVKLYNISINKAITYCLSNFKTPYEKRILSICRSIYPYDGQIQLRTMINCNPVSMDNIDKTYYKIGKHTDSPIRQTHDEDNMIKSFPIGINEDLIYNSSNLKHKNFEACAQIIDPQKIQNTIINKKVKRKRKERID